MQVSAGKYPLSLHKPGTICKVKGWIAPRMLASEKLKTDIGEEMGRLTLMVHHSMDMVVVFLHC